ncbi:tryptophan synthase beta subunit-like PLP-dependent enzyme [Endogone sp. FLAS-F59071]|nr:tryptophan synthase beta subunit-like PLP-dependent enzyme [Endogone sp. FLAS-F59071]|eukprot:RUS20394.1 tryptophan synthase beta subunit-like PLP-dependent enzyme [Endogone sp. FLAS-F59071]
MVAELILPDTTVRQTFTKDSGTTSSPYDLEASDESNHPITSSFLSIPEISPADPALVLRLILSSSLYHRPRTLSSTPIPNSANDVLKIQKTPLQVARRLSKRLDVNVMIKREDAHPEVFSVEARGVGNWLLNLLKACKEDERSVWCVNGGPQADALTLLSNRLSLPNHPTAVEAHILNPLDPYILGGYGTTATELLTQHQTDRIAAVFCPIGATPESWGLAAAVAIYVKRVAPDIRVVAVRFQHRGGKAQNNTWGHEWMDEVLEVTEDEVTMAIKDVYEDTRVIPDVFGALSIAGLIKHVRSRPAAVKTEVKTDNADAKPNRNTYIAILASANMSLDAIARWAGDMQKIQTAMEDVRR